MSARLKVAPTRPKKKNQEISAHYVQINLRVLTYALGYDANTTRNKKAVQISGSGNDQSNSETKSASDSKNTESSL